MSRKPAPPDATQEKKRSPKPTREEPGSNAVEHEPDTQAEPVPDGEPRYVPSSPFTTGND